MPTETLVSVNQFCVYHQVDFSFINSLQEFGLIEIVADQEEEFIQADKLKELEKLVRLHYDMDINLEGIEAIQYLLEKLNAKSNEVAMLKNRLSLYETGELPD